MADTSQVKEITARLEQGVKDIFNSDTYADYLKTMSRFHRYSTRNTVLIHMQRPGATLCCGFRGWQTKFERNVKKGEKAIKILAPAPFVVREEKEQLDPDTKKPIIGEDGMPIVELTERQFARFKVTSVFDISQTDGKPLPSLVQDLTGNVEQYAAFMDALREVSPLPIVIEPMPSDTDGICHFGDKISIREGMSEIQTVCAIIHEITHAKLHDSSLIVAEDENAKPKDRRTEEVEAESVSYAVCQYFGIETGANSFGYLADWSKTRDLKELNASLDTIRKTAAELIDAIDGRFQEIAKDRDITFAIGEEQEVMAGQMELDVPNAAPTLHPLIAEYARAKNDLLIGANALMMPVFIDGNFNREGKKIRVTALEPAGKYQLFSREEHGDTAIFFMTASGRIDHTSQYFDREWDEARKEWVNHIPTEAELDEIIPRIAERFERDMADPEKWASYQHAAVVNRLDDCEAHNVPVRQAQEARRQAESQERARQEIALRQERVNAFETSINDLADTLAKNEKADIEIDRNFDKNPLFTLFDRHEVDLPLATKGWVNRNLRAVQVKPDGTVSLWTKKGAKTSETFCHAIRKLTAAIAVDRSALDVDAGVKEENKTMATTEHQLYAKFAELFPEFMNQEYSTLKMEAEYAKPLALEWVFGDWISIAHTYEKDGEHAYEPMVMLAVNSVDKTMTARSFETSDPPRNDVVYRDGNPPDLAMQQIINSFTAQWLDRAAKQRFRPIEATLWNDGKVDTVDVRVTFGMNGKPIMPETQPATAEPKAADLDMTLPDPSIGFSEMNLCGYHDDGVMLPLLQGRAVELFDADHAIYLLYPDNTEAMALDRDEILKHDGLFGIEREDWERSPILAAQLAAAKTAEGSREANLLYGGENKFGIYQLKGGGETRDYRFEPLDRLHSHGLEVDRKNYELVYTAPLDIRDTQTNLHKIYETLNINRPADFTGHSLSVSDIIVLQWRGNVSSHYVDDIGFTELPSFLGEEKQQIAEAPEQTNSQLGNTPTVAELEADVNAGKAISLMDLAKATHAERGSKPAAPNVKLSLMERLEKNKQRAAQQGQTDPSKATNREV